MKLFEDYETLKQQIFDYFGYVEDWSVLPLRFEIDSYWLIVGSEQEGEVHFANSKEALLLDEDYYCNEIYRQRFLPKWVYRGEEYTLIVVDTHTDSNKFLQVFKNSLEVVE